MPVLWVGQGKMCVSAQGCGMVMEHREGDPRSLTGIPMFVSHQPPDQHLPGHPFHGREQILRPVSLPTWWDAVGRDPALTQLGPHGLLQVGWGGAVRTEQVTGRSAGQIFCCAHTPIPQDQPRILADASDSHWLQFPLLAVSH